LENKIIVEIREVRPEDIVTLAKNLRRSDRIEIRACTLKGASIKEIISDSVGYSTYSRAGFVDGELACLWGTGPVSVMGGVGMPWFLATNLVEQYPMVFLRRCKSVLAEMKGPYTTLENWVYAKNTGAIHWLKWLGFTFDEPKPWGPRGKKFQRFYMGDK
jgi:hypothetical protein